MATRPVYVVSTGRNLFDVVNINFQYFSGFSQKQKSKSIVSLHNAFSEVYKDKKILEISTKSSDELGIRLSAFNLMVKTKSGKMFSVEAAFQSSKVFEHGGPYEDLLWKPSRVAKKDHRLKESGKLVHFYFNNVKFELNPKTYFYNWIYINALNLNHELGDELLQYDAFSDIEFNPQKSINCQAEAVSIYVSLKKKKMLEEALSSKKKFLDIVYYNAGSLR